MQRVIIALLAGIIFGAGLVLAEMVNPIKVQGFLDLFGNWDPSLILVMGGAVTITLLSSRFILRRTKPILADRFHTPVRSLVDRRLILGAVLFGIGWGLSGYCPGPGLINAMINPTEAMVFIPALIIGGWIGQTLSAS
ncbi:MAG: YeeE/YedE family protein [Gammaproteobacteria bacterium]|jgi:hypothetical protein|nr:YeeE/YedE family protein [Gammaproteobacteria bacterium]